MVFLKHNSVKSGIFFNAIFIPGFSGSRSRVRVQSPGSGSRVRVQVLDIAWENTCARVSFLKFYRTPPMAASVFNHFESSFLVKAGLYDEIFLSRPWNFYFERKVSKYFMKRNVCREIIQFVHTIKFHSYDHDNVSLIERINNFNFSCHGYYGFKSCLKILKKRS